MLSRKQVRGRLIARSHKSRLTGQPLCWYCQLHTGAHMHEMLNRNLTVGNDEAREATFQEGLTLLLCPACHDLAPRRSMEARLWQVLYQVYGYSFVYRAYQDVQAIMQSRLPLLPEPETRS